MNHDYAHCLDYDESCPKKCFRGKLVQDLRTTPSLSPYQITWASFFGTDECEIVKRNKGGDEMTVELPEERTKTMRIDEASIDHSAVKIISVLIEANYDLLNSDASKKYGYTLMTLGEINGVIEMAEAMKEVLKA